MPRLFLRRFLIPHFSLTFSTRDSIELEAGEFETFLLEPKRFEQNLRLKDAEEAGRYEKTGTNAEGPALPWVAESGIMNLLVQTPDEILAALPKPRLTDVTRFVLAPEDWLILCAGFEDRSVAVLQSVVASAHSFNVLLITYEPFVSQNRADTIRKICREAGGKIVELSYNRQNPNGFGRQIAKEVFDATGRIVVDVSAMSRLLIVQILVALGRTTKGFFNCSVAFAEAQEYPPTQTEVETELVKSESDPTFFVLFLSSGVFEITVLPELSSFAPAAPQTRLICFPSLDAHHLIALRAEIQPSRLTVIEGVPPRPHNQWRQKVISVVNRLDEIRGGEVFQTRTLDYVETLDCLLRLYAAHSVSERLLIAPTGSKMQTVAVGIFRSFVEDVQIVYPTPREDRSPENYTRGVGQMYLLSLEPFCKPAGEFPMDPEP